MGRRRNRAEERAIATRRTGTLVELAIAAAHDDRLPDADRYIDLAWRLTQRHVLPTPPPLKVLRCRHCGHFQLPGVTSRTRTTRGKLTRTCLVCEHTRRVPFTREQAARRQAAGPR